MIGFILLSVLLTSHANVATEPFDWTDVHLYAVESQNGFDIKARCTPDGVFQSNLGVENWSCSGTQWFFQCLADKVAAKHAYRLEVRCRLSKKLRNSERASLQKFYATHFQTIFIEQDQIQKTRVQWRVEFAGQRFLIDSTFEPKK